MSSSKMITLISSDGETFEVNEAVALEFQTIKNGIEDTCTDDGIPLPKVTGQILAKVLEYCKKHVEQAISDDDLKDWDAEFVEVDQATLFGLIMAADYLNIKSLLELTCQTVADMFKGKTPEERRSARPLTSRMTIPQRKKKRLVRRTGGHLTDVIMGNNLKWVTIEVGNNLKWDLETKIWFTNNNVV